ncbi:MAG: hypothetical protein F4053_13900 [Proteobacteria bacterium]|nr:hypothetical protein [Pseudomonadota bacterium]MYJ96630.1 hypothetical protein [Pseudomonadota bacterium]
MSSRLAAIVAGIAMAFPSIQSLSHHGSNVVYDLTQTIAVAGTVTEFQFVNPHTQILFDVTGDDGAVVGWLAGLPGSIRLTQEEGWSSDTLKPGDEISILGAPARNDAPSVWVEQVFLNGEPMLGDKYTG